MTTPWGMRLGSMVRGRTRGGTTPFALLNCRMSPDGSTGHRDTLMKGKKNTATLSSTRKRVACPMCGDGPKFQYQVPARDSRKRSSWLHCIGSYGCCRNSWLRARHRHIFPFCGPCPSIACCMRRVGSPTGPRIHPCLVLCCLRLHHIPQLIRIPFQLPRQQRLGDAGEASWMLYGIRDQDKTSKSTNLEEPAFLIEVLIA
ncbi:hypothetical protein B0T13DRAFT_165944 [Neurospora crassa]|nr:hypothetical protein B0T13DRAFT_165944 [Neurospora crassa]